MQQPRRFQAATLGEAYAMVRAELGGDAVILSTRKASSPGLFGLPGRSFVEVVAHQPVAMEPRGGFRPSFDQDIAAHELVRGVAEAAAMGLTVDPAVELAPPFENPAAGRLREAARAEADAAAEADEPRTRYETSSPIMAGPFNALNEAASAMAAATPVVSSEPAPPVVESAAPASTLADRALISTLARQLAEVRSLLDGLVTDRVAERVEDGPPVMREVHELLVRQGISPVVLAPLVAQVGDALARGADRDSALRTAERKLAARLPQVAQVDLGRRPAAIFLVGPSGAGKTTMAVRLALEVERAHGLRVVVAGTDVSRAGAPQQLVAYGAASGIDVRLCYAPGELKSILEDGATDIVIVDTPGHNGSRRDRMAELNAFAQVARRRSVLLTLPATMKGADLVDVVAAYSGVGIDGLVLTRCDETMTLGALASVAIEASIGVAYTTHSDQVSDPARAGDNLALANAVVTGRWAVKPADRARAAAAALARVG